MPHNLIMTTDVSEQGVNEYITDLLGSLSEMAGQAGLRRLATDLEDVRQRHELASDLILRTAMISRRAVDA